MSGGLFGLPTLADRTAQSGLGSAPGRNGRDGVSIFDAFQTAGSASFTLVLSNGQSRQIFLPAGAPGIDGITPTFTQGTIQNVANGGTGNFALVPTATPGLYSYNVTLVAGPLPWAPPVAYAAGIAATPGPPATQVTYNKSTFVCTTAHTTTSTFDASKWICVAQGGADGNGTLNGPGSSTDSAFALFDGTTGKLVKDGLVKLSTLASDIWANVANRVATIAALWAAQAPVALPYAATVAPDLSTFLNATLTLTGNCTLANPTNAKAGQSGFITVAQDGTGSRTLAFGSAWKFSGGAPTASTAASAVDGISYYVENASTPIIRAAYLKAFA